ncbi:hypothetical protein [Plantactinospora sp. CA-290183]|uniref:hypothetical protein n=1 Tax=Plantactinospora sp. CA-290183 TaxID=3240006 RepID=UPI003D8D778C
MTRTWTGGQVTFRAATLDETAHVLAVLDEAAAWLRSRHQPWPARLEPDWVTDAIAQGETWLVRAGGRVAATLTLNWSDPLWDDIEGRAGYLHRLAVCRSAAGLGAVLIAWRVTPYVGTGVTRYDWTVSPPTGDCGRTTRRQGSYTGAT